MLFDGQEIRIAKNCDRGLENAVTRGRMRHCQDQNHSFSSYRYPGRQIT